MPAESALLPQRFILGGSPRHRLSPEKQFGVTPREDHKIFQDTFAAHTSLKHSTEVPKVKPGGREEGLRTANGATVGCAQCWSGGSYLLLRVRLERGPPASPRDVWGPPGSGAGGEGQKRPAQFCWWGAWAPWVLRAGEGLGSEEQAPGPSGAGSQGWGEC